MSKTVNLHTVQVQASRTFQGTTIWKWNCSCGYETSWRFSKSFAAHEITTHLDETAAAE